MSDRQAICCQVKLKNRRVRITTDGETFLIRWRRLMSGREIKKTEAILTREAAEATMHLIAALLKETEGKA